MRGSIQLDAGHVGVNLLTLAVHQHDTSGIP
jgi:hypothetical protein